MRVCAIVPVFQAVWPRRRRDDDGDQIDYEKGGGRTECPAGTSSKVCHYGVGRVSFGPKSPIGGAPELYTAWESIEACRVLMRYAAQHLWHSLSFQLRLDPISHHLENFQQTRLSAFVCLNSDKNKCFG